MLKEVKLLILIHYLFSQGVTVQRFTTQTEYGLRFYVARFRNRSTGRITLRNEDHGIYTFLILLIKVIAAVAKLLVVKIGFLGAIVCQFLDTGNFFALTLRLQNP